MPVAALQERAFLYHRRHNCVPAYAATRTGCPENRQHPIPAACVVAIMNRPRHWIDPPDLKAATIAQREIARAAEHRDRFGPVSVVAGVDTSMKWRDTRGPIHAAVAPLPWPLADPFAAHTISVVPPIPYVPGYLGFRECPALLQVLDGIARRPDLVLVDGHGIAHPRRCGIATHLGVVADVPSIGCAKTILCGKVEGELGPDPGDRAPLVDRGEVVAMALRTRPRANPIFVSTGHRISLETAVEWVLKLTDGRRLPLPTRLAHEAANAARRAYSDGAS
ncbi:endonuclease V [Stakelama saccharophila]|uniref:Endonuclease V n=1 Tax=Stakelama saccharophila TaxID=3075605 RepID=A0ABZ0BBY2_9SPHN|nr:endonuclease V [Stakelama sp. W311]WNO54565.1 endonuclease V [Stakelama sp. W311]